MRYKINVKVLAFKLKVKIFLGSVYCKEEKGGVLVEYRSEKYLNYKVH